MRAPLSVLCAGLAIWLAGCGSEGRGAYVGTWQQANPSTETFTRYTFFADGRARIVERLTPREAQTYEAEFSIAGDSLLTLSDATETERFQIRLSGDTLWIRSPITGSTNTLVRVRAGG
ncbi:MAG: hypothetical protein AAF170_10140 [Bacteroidota bacterium]